MSCFALAIKFYSAPWDSQEAGPCAMVEPHHHGCVCECVCVIRVCRGHYMSVLGVMAFYFQEREIDPA